MKGRIKTVLNEDGERMLYPIQKELRERQQAILREIAEDQKQRRYEGMNH